MTRLARGGVRVPLSAAGLDRVLAIVMLSAALFYLATLPKVLERLDPLTGDEPFYVMTAISLLRDGDLDESHNYQQRDYQEFYPPQRLPRDWQGWPAFPRTLVPHPATSTLPGLHTKHGLGLTLLIAAPYALAGRVGADFTIVLLAVVLAGQMFLLARESGAGARLAAAIALGLAVTLPVAPYATLLFPEIPAATLLLYALRRLSAPHNALSQVIATGFAIGFLPWLHQRFVPTVVVLTILLLVRWYARASLARCVAGLAPVAVSGVLLMSYNLWLYGQLTQSSRDHAGFNGATGTLNGAFGLLLDAQWGLWIVAPLMILALASLPHWFAANPVLARNTLLAVTPYLIVVAAYKVWWGEWGPPARYLVPLVPLAAGPLAAWLRDASLAGRIAAGALWSVGAVLTVVGLQDPQRFYHQPNGANNLVRRLDATLGTDLAGPLVAFQPFALAPRHERVGLALLALAVLFVAWCCIWAIPELRSAARPSYRRLTDRRLTGEAE
jgi:hypothetical protein